MMMDLETTFPSEPGTYVLILELAEKQCLEIGMLGEHEFPAGYYAYVGSAQGSGGLAGRINRHLQHDQTKRPHWHIDYLRPWTDVAQIWWLAGSPSRECVWAQILSQRGSQFLKHFGSSDCRCPGHLIFFPYDNNVSWGEYRQSISCDLKSMLYMTHSH
jgi:Uri superfamily endonuclease